MKTNICILVIAVLALTWADSELEESNSDECDPMKSYLVTCPDVEKFQSLHRELQNIKKCRDCYKMKKRLSGVLKFVSLEASEECAMKLSEKGYLVETNSVQQISDVFPSLPVRLQDRIDQVNLPMDQATYDRNDATDATIFILDTGVLFTHDEFQPNRAHFFGETAPPDNSGVGDVNGHGTRCASIAIGANIGVAQGATVQSIRVASTDGTAATDDVIAALDLVEQWWEKNPGSKCVVSYSMISQATSRTLDWAFGNFTENTDCVVLVAAGNFGTSASTADSCDYSPARVPNVITVGASRFRNRASKDDRQDNSNYGPCVDIYAPGRNVDLAAPSGSSNSFYLKSTGTSFSTPAVAGAAAMILSTTNLTPGNGKTMTDLVRDILIETSVKDKLISLPSQDADADLLPSFNRLLSVADNTYYQ